MQEKLGYKIVGKITNFCPALNKKVIEIVTNLTKEDFYKPLKTSCSNKQSLFHQYINR